MLFFCYDVMINGSYVQRYELEEFEELIDDFDLYSL